jgi:hypothetical protein
MEIKPTFESALRALNKLDDDDLSALKFIMPWQYGATTTVTTDEDGFSTSTKLSKENPDLYREQLQQVCWDKFNKNPHVNTAIRGQIGRLTGFGFEISSEVQQIQEVIEETEFDWRNRLYLFWPKFVGRAIIEGELFLCLTVHPDSFVEVDFIDPVFIQSGQTAGGIINHPTKTTLPLIYCIKDAQGTEFQIPSIFTAKYPDLEAMAIKDPGYSADSRTKGGSNRFIVSWDRSLLTKRGTSYLQTVIEWLNYYEVLKKYEIDHKKSSGSYLWTITMEDPKSFRLWLSLSESEKRETGIMAKKEPGGTLVLPPGMKLTAVNPTLPKISEGDTDILHMITSGLNEPEDVSTGQSKGTFASVKASRGPMSDRISDEVSYFEKFLKYDFYAAIFFLKQKFGKFPEFFKVRKAVDFKNEKPIFENVKKKPEFLLDISFPVSEVIDAESRARAYLGVKHGSTFDTLGIPNAEIAKKLGFGNYKKMRLEQATEEDTYPELIPTLDAESVQEGKIEPKTPNLVKRKKVKEGKNE